MDAIETALTVADLETTPDDGRRYELIDGQLVVTAAPVPQHQTVVGRLHIAFDRWAGGRGARAYVGPIGLHLADIHVLQPDLVLLLPGHLDRVGERYLQGPPDVVVEVSSPSTRRVDLGRKRELYAEFGVPEYWFVDRLGGRVLVHRLEGAGYAPPNVAGPGGAGTSTSPRARPRT